MTAVTHYVLGFLFAWEVGNAQPSRVLLIRKARPTWQAGRLNGVGGRIEAGETALDAMRREFAEEAGLRVLNWQLDTVLSGSGWQVLSYSSVVDPAVFDSARTQTDEVLVPVRVDELYRYPVVSNLRVLIPLALDRSGIAKPLVLTDNSPPLAVEHSVNLAAA
jgi:8-oxo-dGTP diphosphatase